MKERGQEERGGEGAGGDGKEQEERGGEGVDHHMPLCYISMFLLKPKLKFNYQSDKY